MGDALDDLLSLAERAYVRMQASQLIANCLEEGNPAILEDLLHQLVLAGAPSLVALQEIREEIRAASRSLRREGSQVGKKLTEALAGLGVDLPGDVAGTASGISRLGLSRSLQEQVRQAAKSLLPEEQRLVDVLCDEANERATTIARRLALLRRLDGAVSDWLECVAYQAARSAPHDNTSSSLPLH